MGTKNDKFLQDYEHIRKLIRVQFLYDDFTVDQAAVVGMSVSRYNELKGTLEAYITSKEDNIESTRVKGKKTFSLKNSMFINGYNYLCDIFGAKNIVPSQFESYIHILQILFDNDHRPMSLTELNCRSIRAAENSTLNNHINELEDMSYIRVNDDGYQKYASLCNDVFDMIRQSKQEILFLDMISLMRNIIQLYLCGNMLFKTAFTSFSESDEIGDYKNPFTFAQSHFEQVLDDEVVWDLICAMRRNKRVELRYRDVDRVVAPLELVTNSETGRRYLLAADEEDILVSMRVDQISYVSSVEEYFDTREFEERLQRAKKYSFTGAVLLRENEVPQKIVLEYLPHMHETIIKLFPDGEINVGENFCTVKVPINDIREIKPWLRRNIGSVKAQDGTPLAEEMAKDAEEWRKVYGAV